MTSAGAADAAFLAALPGYAFAFLLVLCRTGVVVMLMPGLGETDPPPAVRAGLALAISLLLLPVLAPLVPEAPPGLSAAGMVVAELIAGAVLGWLARLPAFALNVCGAVISVQVGLSSVIQYDPALGAQSSALARLLSLLAPLLVLVSGLYALPLSALRASYQLCPPGSLMPTGAMAESVQGAVSAMFGLGLQLSAPFLLTGLLVQAGLGLMCNCRCSAGGVCGGGLRRPCWRPGRIV